jgi:HSP20 family protein
MADEQKALQAREKKAMAIPAEQTRPGPTFLPAVDIFESEREITLLADMPGVKAKDLSIDLRESVLTIEGQVETPESADETELLREYRTGNYFRQFTLSEMIDQSKIDAEIKEGVLRLRLPKVEEAKPRKIAVKAG